MDVMRSARGACARALQALRGLSPAIEPDADALGLAVGPALEDVRASGPVERLLEESWDERSRTADRRERIVESAAVLSFLVCAIGLALLAPSSRPLHVLLAAALVVLYALTSRIIKFPIGAGYVVPSYLVLVPMLLLLPPRLVPLLAALGFMFGALGELAKGRAGAYRLVFSIADAWHTLGPALVLVLFAGAHGTPMLVLVYLAAFVAGCLVDLASATAREAAAAGVSPHVQFRVILVVWLIDACIAPLGVLVAHAVARNPAEIVLLLPFMAVMLLVSSDRNARIQRIQGHVEILARERSRLQNAVQYLGDAVAAKLDLSALTSIILRGSIEALAADGGRVMLHGAVEPVIVELGSGPGLAETLRAAESAARGSDRPCQLEQDGIWALGLPLALSEGSRKAIGAMVVARADRRFREDELSVMLALVERVRQAAQEISAHEQLRAQALTDPLTRLGNRRKLVADTGDRLPGLTDGAPLALTLLDLDGFKRYNDSFGHRAGDDFLTQLAYELTLALGPGGTAYRLGGDEFCVVSSATEPQVAEMIGQALRAVGKRVTGVAPGASFGTALMPHEARDLSEAMHIADVRMYSHKRARAGRVRSLDDG
jgi:diguanylate cyclase (GGDEF)-like protein